ncbi:hypothetical protein MKW98_003076 [Papaver atlanticum]|uniref:Bms1-type G domain-containing protein n=1 Tax=Papaver atlanticum TaxID=357466 RepID=A0AAD4TJ84_9MAGN|nr:hypothetical protein MKW98_003076 [Papaver atlanticum]
MPSAQKNKSHKSRFTCKSSRNNLHKTSGIDVKRNRIGKSECHVGKGAKAARFHHTKMIRAQKRASLSEEKRASNGSGTPPRVIVLFGLTASANVSELKEQLTRLLSPEDANKTTIASPYYKIRATVLEAPHGDLLACMELAKVADLIAFVASASSLSKEVNTCSYIDSFGSLCLSVFKALGLPSTVVLVRDLPLELKKRNDMKKTCMSSLASELPDSKFYPADTTEELHKFMWLFKEYRLTVPFWRSQRPYLMAHEVDLIVNDGSPKLCTLLLSGYLRAHDLSVNQLVHVSGSGDFQISKIDVLQDPNPLKAGREQDLMDSDELHGTQIIHSLLPDLSKQQSLVTENDPKLHVGELIWPTEMEMTEAGECQRRSIISPFENQKQAAESFEGEDNQNSGSDCFHVEDQEVYSDEDTDADTMLEEDEDVTKEMIRDEIRKINDAHAEDEEFPDEVDTPLDVLSKVRFCKYQGLKSLRTSLWKDKIPLPPEYARILSFHNYKATQKYVLEKARDIGQSSGLLEHESKMSVLHFGIKKHKSYQFPIKGKESLIFHVGFWQFAVRPIFSADSINSNQHKMEKFLHEGRFVIASVYAPVSFPPSPLIALKMGNGEVGYPAVAATGSLKSIDPEKIILKKIILTGYPRRVSKLKATVRYMFHDPRDVSHIKPVEIWTKKGVRGNIKESVSTHGTMKCTFNHSVQQHDTV